MNEKHELQISAAADLPKDNAPDAGLQYGAAPHSSVQVQDERYPGSFFRVPGVPIPGKTVWKLAE